MKLPTNQYQVYNSTDLDDLVLWFQQPEFALNYAKDHALRQRINDCLPDSLCFSGPINSQKRYHPQEEERVEFPVIYHIELSPDSRLKVFLWVTEGTVELHIPEILFVTGKRSEDKFNLQSVITLSDNLTQALGCQWTSTEYEGRVSSTGDITLFWEKYINELFSRISYEEIDI